eukprot:TRINITY_DN9242_c0_g1_i1.p1 TRINITY_DN9242_c0_g1~~TRINITY_DN9242_c0_g1_i1.p1  ORF type:complete len:350 (+),score=100.54 TRINITY_DN9242_c0_g1_i1:57-1052(+)
MLHLLLPLLAASALASPDALTFLAVGDWGGTDHSPYTEPGEVAAAKGMGQVAKDHNSKFVVALGDNFYFHGIQTDCHDGRFKKTFEDVYTAESLQTPWYITAGNHDHKGNVTAQIAYSDISKRWTYPNLRQTWTTTVSSDETKGSVTFQIVLFDTVVVAGDSYYDEERDVFVKPTGPASEAAAADTWKWLEETLAASKADYLWVGGHYPVWSACQHGPTKTLVTKLLPLLERYKVTGYMSGHDHCQEFIDVGTDHPVFVLTGMGDNCCYYLSNKDRVPKGSLKFHVSKENRGKTIGGFAAFKVNSDEMKVTYYDQDGKEEYTTRSIAPRRL